MRPILLLLVPSLYLSSCASINRPYTGIFIRSKTNSEIVYDHNRHELFEMDGDTTYGTISSGNYRLKGDDARAYIVTKRSSEPMPLTIKDERSSRTVYLKPRITGLHRSNNKDLYPAYRFTYPRKIYVDFRDTGNHYTHFKQPHKGDVQLKLSPAIGNVWGFSFGKRIRGASPMLGTALGVSHWYDNKHFVSLSFGIASSSSGFCPDGCRYIDSVPVRRTRQTGYYTSVRHHHLLGRFDVGYGVYLARHKWEIYDTYMQGENTIDKEKSSCFGPALSAHFQIFTFLYGGFEYQPMFFTIDKTTPKGYQHILNVGVQFRFTPKRHSKWV